MTHDPQVVSVSLAYDLVIDLADYAVRFRDTARRAAPRRSGTGAVIAGGPQMGGSRIRGGAGCCAPNPITVFWETAVLFHLRDACRAGDERRCCRLPPSLMPTAACRSRPVRTTGSPSAGSPLDEGVRRPGPAARVGAVAGGSIEDSQRPTSGIPRSG